MKKGFTLIELLGVIIVLLVISLITFPLINSQINKAKEGLSNATKEIVFASARNYIESASSDFYDGQVYCVTIEELITSGKLEESLIGDLDKSSSVEVKVDGEKIDTNIVKNCNGLTLNEDNSPKIKGAGDIQVLQWTEFDKMKGVTATDSKGKDITGRITVDGDITTTIVNTYTLTYKVSDEAGNTATKKRKVTVIPSEYIDNSGAATPNLKGGLIPVTIADNGTVNKADVTSRWYDYDEKKWANAVILDDDIIPDVSGNGNHGYLQNSPIRNEGSITTNGSNSYVYAGLPSHAFQNEFSIAIRVNVKNYLNENDKDMFENLEGGGIGLAIENKNFKFDLYSSSQKTYIALRDTNVVNLNEWYTVVGTFKDNMMHLYVNGKEVSNGLSFNASDIVNVAAPFIIGGNPGNCDTTNHTCPIAEAANIEFSDALIFDRALSTDEIASEFSGKITNISNTSKIILRYELDDPIPNNTVLPEEVIESYFVWIPKYRYQIFDLGNYSSPSGTVFTGNAKTIQIVFNTLNTQNITGKECATTNQSGNAGECDVGDWMTHPAFTSFGVDGFWIGKFEVGYKGATSTSTSQVNSNDSAKIIIKPNAYGWRSITVKNIFEASFQYDRALDSHMLKNTEWGAVAYLSHSKYGIGDEVRINNNSNYLTGSAANSKDASGSSTTNSKWNTSTGYLASTTGNITGVYDMNGGASEYVAGYYEGSILTKNDNSGFTSADLALYDAKYFDKYVLGGTNYTNRILGDTIGEIGPFNTSICSGWYSDYAHNVSSTDLWFTRGGQYGNTKYAGQFNFSHLSGVAYALIGFRLALAPK